MNIFEISVGDQRPQPNFNFLTTKSKNENNFPLLPDLWIFLKFPWGTSDPNPTLPYLRKVGQVSWGTSDLNPTLTFFEFSKSLAQVLGDQRPQVDLDQIKKAELPLRMKRELCLFFAALERRTTCLTDKTNHPVKGLSLNRSQYGSCSTKYDTPAGS